MSNPCYNVDNPYYAEHARSGRAECKGCFKKISEGDPRIAVLVQSHWDQGKMPQWYHLDCFFEEEHPKNVEDIANVDKLYQSEQEEIKQQIALNNLRNEEESEVEEDESDEEESEEEEDESDEEEESDETVDEDVVVTM